MGIAVGLWGARSVRGLLMQTFILFIICLGKENNFKKKTIEEVTGLGLPYDYDGLMHYGAYAFAKDRSKPVIVKLKNTGGNIGQRIGMSTTDIQQINALYDCKSEYF